MINIIGYLGFKSDCIYLHFLNGNKSLQKMILGLKPDEEKHDTFVSIEPKLESCYEHQNACNLT